MNQNDSTFDKTIVEISKKLINEIAEKIKGYNESFSKKGIIDYIDRKKEREEDEIYKQLLEAWAEGQNDLTMDKQEKGRLFFHLISVSSMISQITESRCMVFMIQDPEATDMIQDTNTKENLPIQKYKTYPFGMKSNLRASWDDEIDKRDKITFTDILFGKNIVGNDIFCIRIGKVKSGEEELDNLIYIDIIGEFKDNTFEIHDKRLRIKYSSKKEDILMILDEELSDKDKVINYVNFMVKHTEFNPFEHEQFFIYAIPVLSISLYPSCPSRSGLYIVSTKNIKYEKLLTVQNLISQLLCHIDYLRAAIIQRTEDIRLFTHDLQGSLKYLNRHISDEKIKGSIEFMNLLIDCLNGIPKEINNIDYPLIKKILEDENWLVEASNFSALLEERWIPKLSESQISLSTKTNTNFLPKIILDEWSGTIASLIFVLLRNAWKHQYFFYNFYKAKPYIRVDLEKTNGKWILFIKNNFEDIGNNNTGNISEKRKMGKGTFAISQKLLALINESENKEVRLDFHLNYLKKDFITKLYLSSEVLK